MLNDTAKNLMLDALGGEIAFLSLHDDTPTAGANELSGGSPAYARKAVVWNEAASGELDDSSNGIDFDVPAGSTVAFVGFWSAATDGTFYGYAELDTPEVFAGQGVYTVEDGKITLPDPE